MPKGRVDLKMTSNLFYPVWRRMTAHQELTKERLQNTTHYKLGKTQILFSTFDQSEKKNQSATETANYVYLRQLMQRNS